jgi:phosphoribosyl 1,2-cyclic phosphodiesterase
MVLQVLVRFWGTRGSLPTAVRSSEVRDKLIGALKTANGRHFQSDADIGNFVDKELDFSIRATYGGASSCVELDGTDNEFLVCDMGSGLREFGLDSIQRCHEGRGKTYNIFMSHLHWDHIMGFPFFVPAFDPEVTIRIFGGHDTIEQALRRQQEKISFPVPFDFLQARFEFTTLVPGEVTEVAGCQVELIRQNHDNDSYGYRFSCNEKSVVYSTDSEHKLEDRISIQHFIDFFRDADLIVMDTMYSLADSVSMKADWGHSSNVVAVDLCHRANARRLAMFHHEPIFNDSTIRELHLDTIRYEELMRKESALEVLCAYDGLEILL